MTSGPVAGTTKPFSWFDTSMVAPQYVDVREAICPACRRLAQWTAGDGRRFEKRVARLLIPVTMGSNHFVSRARE